MPTAIARWANISLKDLLKETDMIVVATLTNVTETTTNRVEYSSGTLVVGEVIRGNVKTGDRLQLRWENSSDIACPRIEHASQKGKTVIWLLQSSTNNTVSANYPGRVLEMKLRPELDQLLRKK